MHYISPDRQGNKIDYRTDLYSYLMMYEMLTGSYRLRAKPRSRSVMQHINGFRSSRSAFVPGIPGHGRRVMPARHERSISRRYGSAEKDVRDMEVLTQTPNALPLCEQARTTRADAQIIGTGHSARGAAVRQTANRASVEGAQQRRAACHPHARADTHACPGFRRKEQGMSRTAF